MPFRKGSAGCRAVQLGGGRTHLDRGQPAARASAYAGQDGTNSSGDEWKSRKVGVRRDRRKGRRAQRPQAWTRRSRYGGRAPLLHSARIAAGALPVSPGCGPGRGAAGAQRTPALGQPMGGLPRARGRGRGGGAGAAREQRAELTLAGGAAGTLARLGRAG